MTDEEWEATQNGLHRKATGLDPKAAAPASNDPNALSTIGSTALDFGKGALKGAAGNVTGLVSAAHNVIGTPDLPQSVKDLTAIRPDASFAEQAGGVTGDYGSLAIPGLDFGLGAKLGAKAGEWAISHGPEFLTLAKKFGADRAQQIVETMWAGRNAAEKGGGIAAKGAIGGVAHDPEHPGEGAVLGAATPVIARGAGTAAKTIARNVPPTAKWLADKAATGAAIYGAEHIAHGQGHRGGGMAGWPAFYLGHNLPSALAGIAALALGAPPGAQGAAGASLFGSGDNRQ